MGMGGAGAGRPDGDAGLLGRPQRGRALRPPGRRRHRGQPAAAARPRSSPAKAKRVIHLFMNGGPSHVDTFDPKPSLTKYHGKPLPLEPADRAEDRRGVRLAVQVPEVRPERHRGQRAVRRTSAECIDDICVIRSMHADVPNHEPSLMLMNCGDARQARPSVGSWLTLRPRDGEPEPARLHRDVPRRLCRSPRRRTGSRRSCPGIYQGTYIDSQHTDIEKLIEHIKQPLGRPDGPARPARPADAS